MSLHVVYLQSVSYLRPLGISLLLLFHDVSLYPLATVILGRAPVERQGFPADVVRTQRPLRCSWLVCIT